MRDRKNRNVDVMRGVTRFRGDQLTPSATLFVILAVFVSGVRGLTNVSIDIPLAVAAGSTVNMTCRYNLGSDELYTVKWYKGREFYRYVQKEMPPIDVFGDLGAKVIKERSDAHHVVLKDVQPDHSGKYRCEVSADSPSFNTLMVSGYMYVADLPKGDPQVQVEKRRYAVGDTVRGNCTVPSGNPQANVTWTVNGVPVNSSFTMNKIDDNQQLMTVARLNYEIIPDSFSSGRLHIICHANVFHLYNKQADILLIEERPRLASVLGTRESSYVGGAVKHIDGWSLLNISVMLMLCNLR